METHISEGFKKHWRLAIFLLLYIPIVVYIVVVVSSDFEKLQHPMFWVITIAFLIIFAVFVIQFYISNFKKEKDLEELKEERKIITTKIEEKNEYDIVQIIQLSLNHITEYYTINKGQAKSSFQVSIFAIVVGLIAIISGISLVYIHNTGINSIVLTSVSGILLEFIGGAYFFMYKRSLEQINLFYHQLIQIQDTMLSIDIAKKITDPAKRAEAEEKIITCLLQRSSK